MPYCHFDVAHLKNRYRIEQHNLDLYKIKRKIP